MLNVTGSGCRPKATSAALSLDRAALTIIYSTYMVESAGGSTATVSKNCRINLRIDPVPGYAPAITSVDYRGIANLGSGSVAALSAAYRFHGTSRTESAALRLTGPFADDWQATDTAEGGLVVGRCTGSNVLDVDSALSIAGGGVAGGPDYLAMDSTDGVVPNTYRLTWQPCP